MGHAGNWSERKVALERRRLTQETPPRSAPCGPDEFHAPHLLFWGQRLIAICCTCRRAVDIELKPLGAAGDLRRLKLRCLECGSRDVVTGVRKQAVLRNDPADDETERVARELCASLELDPDVLADGEPKWRRYIEMAINAIDSWRVLRA